jgi:hypothetical protein
MTTAAALKKTHRPPVQYAWADGSRLKIDAQAAGEHLEKLRKLKGGPLSNEDIVADARSLRSPLHAHFEWDDQRAATMFRLDQAGYILRSITYVELVEDDEGNEVEMQRRRYFSVEDHAYEDVAIAMESPELRAVVISKALREFEAFRSKYEDLDELAGLFAAFDKVKKTRK